MEAKQLAIKAYLNQVEEIRRFYVDVPSSDASLYSVILGRVCGVFEISSSDMVKLSWKDSDGDFVTFSSDEELRHALSFVPENGELKVFVSHTLRQDPAGTLHLGIMCDQCAFPIVGMRYKCLECTDFDLCQPCLTRGVHREHIMVMIPRPECLQNPPWASRKRGSANFRGRRNWGSSRCPAQASEDSEFTSSGERVRERLAALGLGDQPSAPGSLSASNDSTTSQVGPVLEAAGGFVMVNDTNMPSFDPLPMNIQAALNQMKAMGFVDQRGWLTKMLLKYNGDIPKCLDEIQKRSK